MFDTWVATPGKGRMRSGAARANGSLQKKKPKEAFFEADAPRKSRVDLKSYECTPPQSSAMDVLVPGSHARDCPNPEIDSDLGLKPGGIKEP